VNERMRTPVAENCMWPFKWKAMLCPSVVVPSTFTQAGQSTDHAYPLPALNQVRVRVTATGRVEVLGTAW
jgi:hypothetical protein